MCVSKVHSISLFFLLCDTIQNNTFYVENLFIFEVESAAQARELFSTGVKSKAMGSHQMNLQSSRSHSVFTIYIESWDTQVCLLFCELFPTSLLRHPNVSSRASSRWSISQDQKS